MPYKGNTIESTLSKQKTVASVELLLQQLSLQEKVGQMTQIAIDVTPQYEFGHGLSYTTFQYENLELNKTTIATRKSLAISIDVTNTGSQSGKESVPIYVSDLHASITPVVKQLKAFQKIQLAAGVKRRLTFIPQPKNFQFIGLDQQWTSEAGTFRISIGGKEVYIELVP